MPPFTGLTAALNRFQTALAQPKQTQQAVLADILHRNRDCAFGREHRFAELKDYGDFARALPVCRYEDFSPSIGQIAAGRSGILTAEAISNFEETGGSSGGAKLIPYTDYMPPSAAPYCRGWPTCNGNGRRHWPDGCFSSSAR